MTTEQPPSTAAALDRHCAPLLARCTFPAAGTAVVCALSGGPDSSALVALAVAARLRVQAVHVDHVLRDASGHDADAARDIAERLGAKFECVRIEVGIGPNQEARARAARRGVLGLDALTGHTADDQAETVLLALSRGAGAAGLAAMSPGPTKPILALRRTDTDGLCIALDLPVAVDITNADVRFRRNRVRHELLPLLNDIAQRDTAPLITRTAALLRDDDQLLEELAAAVDPTDAIGLASAPVPLARRAVRAWLRRCDGLGGYAPDAAAVERVLAVARGDATSCDVSSGWRVARSHQRLRLFCNDTPTQ